MKKLITLSAVVLFTAFLFLKNYTSTIDVTNELLLENVQAMAYGGGGNGEIDPDPTDPENPPQPVYLECYSEVDYGRPSSFPNRKCKKEGPQKSGNSECVDQFTYYYPKNMNTCIVPGTEPTDPQ